MSTSPLSPGQSDTVLHVRVRLGRHDSRILKEARSVLQAGMLSRAMLVGHADADGGSRQSFAPGIEMEQIRLSSGWMPRGLLFQVIKGLELLVRIVLVVKDLSPRIIHAHSLYSLPVSIVAGWLFGIPVVYDAHELETERNGSRGARQRFDRVLERALVGRCDAVLCVSDAIADWYAAAYGSPRPTVVRNIPDVRWQGDGASSPALRERLGVPEEAMIFLYQGALSPGRRIEQLLRVFATTGSDRHLVIMGYGALEAQVRGAASAHANIHFQPAVPPGEVLLYTASADVGICGGENVCLSYYYSLPNKLFEYLLAGLPILVPDWPEMRRIVDGRGCGWVVGESDDDWRALIDGLTREGIAARAAAARSAAQLYSWANEEQALLAVYLRLLAPRPA